MSIEIRHARAEDLRDLNDLYNHYVETSPVTFDLEPIPIEARKPWLEEFAPGTPHQLFVADTGGRVVGYAGSKQFRPKAAYATTVETTIYLAPDATGQGLGRRLYTALFAALEDQPVHRALAGITLPNPASIALHEAFEFARVALFSEVGFKDGRYWDVAWFEKPLS